MCDSAGSGKVLLTRRGPTVRVCVCVRVELRDSGGFTSDPSTPRQTSNKMRKEGEGRRESWINAEEAKREEI